MKSEQPLMVRSRGGLSRAPSLSLSVWGPILVRVIGVLITAVVLAVIGMRATTGAWNGDGAALQGALAAVPSVPTGTADGGGGGRESAVATIAPSSSTRQPSQAGLLPDGRIVLNVATEEELVRLPGIGPTRAHAIVALRERLGRFRSVHDLRRVKGIGRKTLQRIAANVVVDAPRSADTEKDAG